MLKHLSQRSESRNSYLEEYEFTHNDNSQDSLPTAIITEKILNDTTVDSRVSNTVDAFIPEKPTLIEQDKRSFDNTEPKSNLDGISILLTKPTIKKIIDKRRQSELYLKENIQAALNQSESTTGEKRQEKPTSPVEEIEEVLKDNSKLVIHRRKKEQSDKLSESGTTSQVITTNSRDFNENKNNFEIIDAKNNNIQLDFWKVQSDFYPPVGFSSPKRENQRYKSLDYLNSNDTQLFETTNSLHGYRTLDGRSRPDNLQIENHSIENHKISQRIQKRNLELKRLRENNFHLNQFSPTTHSSGQTDTMDQRQRQKSSSSDYLCELPRKSKLQRPHSVAADMRGYNKYDDPYHKNLLVQANQKYSQRNSLNGFTRHDKHRGSSHSVGADSSVSNIIPQTTRSIDIGSSVSKIIPQSNCDCPCGTLGRKDILEKINEEIEQENEFHEELLRRKNIAQRRCKYLTILFVIIAVLSCLIGGMLLFFVGNFPQTIYLNQGDVKLINVSSTWCSGVKVMSKQSNVRAITFSKEEPRSNSTPVSTPRPREDTFVIEAQSVWSRKFYLLKGSTLKFKVYSTQPVDILSFESKHRYDMWVERKESKTYIERISCCQNTIEKAKEITIHATTDDTYVIAIYRQGLFAEEVKVEMTENRFAFEFISTTDSCTAEKSKDCSVNYNFNTDEGIAIELPYNSAKITDSFEVEWKCVARGWFYFVVFFGTYLGLMCLFLILYIICTRCRVIPLEKVCCLKRKHKSIAVDYYDNLGKTQSDIGASESQQTYSNSSRYLLKPKSATLNRSRGGSASLSDSSQNLTNLFHPRATTLPRLSSRKDNFKTNNNNAAVIHSEHTYDMDSLEEKADSGISVDPNLTPPGHHTTNANHFFREMDFEHLKTLHHHQLQGMELVNAPRVRDLLYRSSDITQPVQYNSHKHDLLEYRQEMHNRGLHSNYDLYFDSPRVMPVRTHSVSDTYKHGDSIQINELKTHHGSLLRQKKTSYDNRELYI